MEQLNVEALNLLCCWQYGITEPCLWPHHTRSLGVQWLTGVIRIHKDVAFWRVFLFLDYNKSLQNYYDDFFFQISFFVINISGFF